PPTLPPRSKHACHAEALAKAGPRRKTYHRNDRCKHTSHLSVPRVTVSNRLIRSGQRFVSPQLPLRSTATLAASPAMSLAPVAPFTCNFGLTSAQVLDGRNAFTPVAEHARHPD